MLLGESYSGEGRKWYGLFVSRDGGFSWSVVSSLHEMDFTIIHIYTIILYHPEYSKSVWFSLDEGRNWVNIPVGKRFLVHSQIFDLTTRTSVRVLLVAFEFTDFVVIDMDLSHITKQICLEDDMIQWTLSVPTGNCFLGQSYTFRSRINEKMCVLSEMHENTEKSACTCHLFDLECKFGYQISEGICRNPSEYQCDGKDVTSENIFERYDWKTTSCKKVNGKAISLMDSFQTSEICHDGVSTYFVLVKPTFEMNILKLPQNRQLHGLKLEIWKGPDSNVFTDIEIDFKSKYFYNLQLQRINRIPMVTHNAQNLDWEIYDNNLEVSQIGLDSVGRNLFYLDTKQKLGIINLHTRMKKPLLSYYKVKSFKLHLEKGLIFLKLTNLTLLSCSVSQESCIIAVPSGVTHFSYDGNDKIYFGNIKNPFTVYHIHFDTQAQTDLRVENEFIRIKSNVTNIYMHNTWIFIMSAEEIVFYDTNAVHLEKYIVRGEFTKIIAFNPDLYKNDPCSNVNCPGICLVLESKHVCICSEDYVFKNGVCLCNWFNCTGHCSPEDFVCDDLTCLRTNKICNGIPDCFGGEDEKICPEDGRKYEMKPCPESQISCRNGYCVNNTNICNGIKDCSNNLDEDGCETLDINDCDPSQPFCPNLNCFSDSTICSDQYDCKASGLQNEYYKEICECQAVHSTRCSNKTHPTIKRKNQAEDSINPSVTVCYVLGLFIILICFVMTRQSNFFKKLVKFLRKMRMRRRSRMFGERDRTMSSENLIIIE